jgi:hypothetical protein
MVNDKVLKFDALSEAEKLTGKSYKEDQETAALGMLLMMENNKAKEQNLRAERDTYFNQSLATYLDIMREIGFNIGVADPFQGNSKQETYYILWRPDGILLTFDTYGGDHLNGGSFYYNWVPYGEYYPWISSGSGHDIDGLNVWEGYHDCREAVRHKLRGLQEHGKFLAPWKVGPSIHLGHYKTVKPPITEWTNYLKAQNEINLHYLALLPVEAQALFLPAYEQTGLLKAATTVVPPVTTPVRKVQWK